MFQEGSSNYYPKVCISISSRSQQGGLEVLHTFAPVHWSKPQDAESFCFASTKVLHMPSNFCPCSMFSGVCVCRFPDVTVARYTSQQFPVTHTWARSPSLLPARWVGKQGHQALMARLLPLLTRRSYDQIQMSIRHYSTALSLSAILKYFYFTFSLVAFLLLLLPCTSKMGVSAG